MSNMANASSYPPCSDLSDVQPFFKKKGLFFKPLVKINVSIQIPKSKSTEYSISNHALMEAVKELARPDEFCSIKTTKTAVDLVRLEAEVEVPKNIKWIIPRIEGQTIRLPGHAESFKVRASMAKNDFPTRHDWDSFFRDAKHMNELKAGERPDTIHIQDLPIEWFTTKPSNGKPNEKLVCRIFEQFGAISALDIPSNDPYRSQMKDHISGMKQFNFRSTNLFEAYIQYKDYLSFVCAMDALRGMKLLKKEDEKACTQVVKVDFDKTKHLSESSIRKRKLLREKLMDKERQDEERCEKVVDNVVQTKVVSETLDDKEDEPKQDEESGVDVSLRKILREEKLFLFAQRKLESIRLLGELLERVADKKTITDGARPEKRIKQKSIVSLIKQPNSSTMYVDQEEDFLESSFSSTNSLDGPLYNRAEDYNWRGRGRGFMNNRRGRGRPMRRGGDFFNSNRNNSWEDYSDYNNQSAEGSSFNSRGGVGFNSRGRDGFNFHGGDDFNNWRGGRGYRYNNNRRGRGRTTRDNIPMPGFSRKEQEFNEYNYQMHAMYYRYFQNLTREGKSRSRSRSYSRERGRSRSRSRHRSSSRGRDRSKSRHRSSSRGRDHSKSRHRSSSRGRDYSKSHHRSSSKGRDRSRSCHRSSSRGRDGQRCSSKRHDRSRSRHRSSSKGHNRSTSHSRKRKSRSKSRRRSRSRSKSHRRSRSWTSTKRSKSRSRSWSQRRCPASHSSKTLRKSSQSKSSKR